MGGCMRETGLSSPSFVITSHPALKPGSRAGDGMERGAHISPPAKVYPASQAAKQNQENCKCGHLKATSYGWLHFGAFEFGEWQNPLQRGPVMIRKIP